MKKPTEIETIMAGGFKIKQAILGYGRLRKLKLLYKSHKNPIYMWEAYATCREWKIDIPEWVLSYLDDCAGNLMTIDQPPRHSDKVYEALRFNTSKRSPYKRREDTETAIDVALRVQALRNQGKVLEKIYSDLAEELGLSESTVEKYYRKYKETINSPLPSHD
tara:strand:- start:418 stop:906 length:489 start_codon:yes stop_codon:yes gene_type:complete